MLLRMQNSKHVVEVHETVRVGGEAHFIMEYCEGGTLLDLINREGRVSSSTAARILEALAEFANDCLAAGIVKQFRHYNSRRCSQNDSQPCMTLSHTLCLFLLSVRFSKL